MPFEIVS
jgi:hypothetical protein